MRLVFYDDCGGLNLVHVHPIRGIFAGVAGCAVVGLDPLAAGSLQSIHREIGQRICADVLTNFFYRFVRGDQLFLGRRVHSVETGRNRRRTGNPHVDFLGASTANHADNLAAGGAAYD